jgi:hypothetical protein
MISVIKNLKKENEFLKGKCENSDIALVKLIEEVIVHRKSYLLAVLNQVAMLRPQFRQLYLPAFLAQYIDLLYRV